MDFRMIPLIACMKNFARELTTIVSKPSIIKQARTNNLSTEFACSEIMTCEFIFEGGISFRLYTKR